MSYDISLMVDTGGPELVEVVEVGNYTSNCSPMWRAALGFPLADMAGRVAGDCVADLKRAVQAMLDSPDRYALLNPENGWGDSVTGRKYLERFAELCEAHPETTVWISR